MPNFQLFGPAHLVMLALVPLVAAVLAVIQRRLATGSRAVRLALGVTLLADVVAYYTYLGARGQLTFPGRVPLELCDLSLFLVIIALFTLNQTVAELAYFGALGGATQAMLTPNFTEHFPSYIAIRFFLDHGLSIIGALFLVWSRLSRPRPGCVLRSMVILNIYAAFVGLFDFIFKTNFMFLRAKPVTPSLLDVLGPWPWYIFSAEFLGVLVFSLLYLPFRLSARRAVPEPVPTLTT